MILWEYFNKITECFSVKESKERNINSKENFLFISLKELIRIYEEDGKSLEEIKEVLIKKFSGFKVSKSKSIEEFITEGKMMSWEKKDMARTYLFISKKNLNKNKVELIAFLQLQWRHSDFLMK